eukprot:gb/GECH01004699.1/.p1 GENE.gb/GECH01004699.1/~~gb/GECH01004699.1/.p1  ORF type:complete len:623 (+),score=161.61 gb/GECH01004699.1/:1-1869(+)
MSSNNTNSHEPNGTPPNKKRRLNSQEDEEKEEKRRAERAKLISMNFNDDLMEWSEDNMRYIVVTGGVLSGLGKGVTTSCIGTLLRHCGYRVTALKIDPYLNTDAGTMSPFEHGEVYVLDDGGEADLDLGNYERFMDLSLASDNNLTTGKVYQKVIEKERRGDYLGKTVQVIPHVTNEIMNWVRRVAHTSSDGKEGYPDVCIIEVGGTIGDIESMPFVEALRQLSFKVGHHKFCLVHASLIPVVNGSQKSKPTQHSIKELRALGLSPDLIVCRCEVPVSESVRQKIALHCHVSSDRVLSVHNVSNLFRVPALFDSQSLPSFLISRLGLPERQPMCQPPSQVWEDMAAIEESAKEKVNIAIVGKYTGFEDAYLSVIKALKHSANAVSRRLKINWIEASNLEGETSEIEKSKYQEAWRKLRHADGVLVPGGFGDRGVEGKIAAASWARRSGIPYLGVCLGFQVAVIAYARDELKWLNANSEEFDSEPKHRVLIYMPEVSREQLGGTMRLGARPAYLKKGSTISKLYDNNEEISERHRHRYEVNPEVVDQLEEAGLHFVGRDDTGERMEVFELPRDQHPYYMGVQYHPEYKSRPNRPAPPFYGLVMAASGVLEENFKTNVTQPNDN